MKSDAAFLADLRQSREIVARRAQEFRALGLVAEVVDHEDRPDSAVRMQYGDSGDLVVAGRVEHKRRRLHFTGAHDYPYQTIFIDEQYKIDSKDDVAMAYIIENMAGTCAAVVHGFTRRLWRLEKKWDATAKRFGTFYTIDKQHVRFCPPQETFVCLPDERKKS